MVNDNVVIPATFTDFAFSKSCVLLMYDMEQVGKTPEEDFLGITNPPG